MKSLVLTLTIAIALTTTAFAQTTENPQEDQKVIITHDEMPEFPGGKPALIEFLSTNVKYPKDAEKQKIEGKVVVSFVIEKDGSISDVEVTKPVYPSLDAEAVRVIKAMPKWKPGKQDDKFVRVKFKMPVNFRLKFRK